LKFSKHYHYAYLDAVTLVKIKTGFGTLPESLLRKNIMNISQITSSHFDLNASLPNFTLEKTRCKAAKIVKGF
jgi:hypothetical protein